MSLSTYYLEYGRHFARLRRRRRHAYAPTSDTASHDNHEKINSLVSFSLLYEYGAPLGGPSGRRSSAITLACRDTKASNTAKIMTADNIRFPLLLVFYFISLISFSHPKLCAFLSFRM